MSMIFMHATMSPHPPHTLADLLPIISLVLVSLIAVVISLFGSRK